MYSMRISELSYVSYIYIYLTVIPFKKKCQILLKTHYGIHTSKNIMILSVVHITPNLETNHKIVHDFFYLWTKIGIFWSLF